MEPTATTPNTPWTIDPAAVREATLAIITDADAAHFACVAVARFGIPEPEAERIGEFIATTQMRAHGCIR